MPFGNPGAENAVLNIDSLWSGDHFSHLSVSSRQPPWHHTDGIESSLILVAIQHQIVHTISLESESGYSKTGLEASSPNPLHHLPIRD